MALPPDREIDMTHVDIYHYTINEEMNSSNHINFCFSYDILKIYFQTIRKNVK